MTNPLRGEVKVADTDIVLTFDVNAFCLAEMALGKTTDAILEDFEAMRSAIRAGGRGSANMVLIRGLWWAGLSKHRDVTIDEAAADMPLPLSNVITAINEGLVAAFGEAEGEDRPSPRRKKKAASTG